MKVGRTSIFNFMSEEDCDKYIAMHTQKMPELLDWGILELSYVRASPESLLVFTVLESDEKADKIISHLTEWRKKYDFKFVETITFNGELFQQIKR